MATLVVDIALVVAHTPATGLWDRDIVRFPPDRSAAVRQAVDSLPRRTDRVVLVVDMVERVADTIA